MCIFRFNYTVPSAKVCPAVLYQILWLDIVYIYAWCVSYEERRQTILFFVPSLLTYRPMNGMEINPNVL